MKKSILLLLAVIFITAISCRDSKKDQEETDINLEKIEALESDLDQTNEELNEKAKEAQDALNELDN